VAHLITTSGGRRFEARPDEHLLDAALRQHVVLDHSCRVGRCSSCKAQVSEGQTVPTQDECGLTPAEREQGFILTCVRRAVSDVCLQIADLGDTVLPETRTLPCRIQTLERLAPDVMAVWLRLPPGSPLSFLPGQYIDVIGPGGVRRSYSLANAPRPDSLLELHIRAVQGGEFSAYWFEKARVNDLLRLRGPHGTFFLRHPEGKDLVFLATGTGMAPVKAMLELLQLLPDGSAPRSVTIYWGGRRPSDLYWAVPEAPSWRYVPVLSRADPNWHGQRGHVQDALLRDGFDAAHTLVYACGSETMIHSARDRLLAAGLPSACFHSDAFVSSASTP
jgi:CDP-4-dehydro-6-deoxyglucose reductase